MLQKSYENDEFDDADEKLQVMHINSIFLWRGKGFMFQQYNNKPMVLL